MQAYTYIEKGKFTFPMLIDSTDAIVKVIYNEYMTIIKDADITR